MSRKELIERFGEEIGKEVPMDSGRKDDKTPEDLKRATVYEIWDKAGKKAYWINKDYKDPLDERDDPLKLKKFFPCPEPVFATLANDSLVPTPDYVQYQDQAKELDDLTGRINSLVKALKVVGVYDASAPALARMLGEGMENVMIPVEQWAVFGEKGGLKGVLDFLPIEAVANVLVGLYDARERTKQSLYEVTGISDVIRGATDPNETLGAQELKSKYAGLRIGAMQADVARFSRDLVRIFAEIIAEHFSLDTIKQLSGFQLMTMQEKQMAQQMAQMQPDVPMPDEVKEMMELPTWEEIEGLLKDDMARCFRIDIETDSTIKVDQDADKAARNEFLAAAGGFIQQSIMAPPDLQPLLMEMLKFGVKGFKIGRELETTFDMTLRDMKAKLENPAPQPPDPAAMEAAAKEKEAQDKMQIEQQKIQVGAQLEQDKLSQQGQFKQAELQQQLQIKQMELEHDLKVQSVRAQADASAKVQIEGMKLEAQTEIEEMKARAQIHIAAMTSGESSDE